LVASFPVLLSDKLNEGVVDVGSSWEEETATGAQLMEKEQVLITTQLPMVSLSSFFLEVFPFLELFTVWE
jgi:hypothetical protein